MWTATEVLFSCGHRHVRLLNRSYSILLMRFTYYLLWKARERATLFDNAAIYCSTSTVTSTMVRQLEVTYAVQHDPVSITIIFACQLLQDILIWLFLNCTSCCPLPSINAQCCVLSWIKIPFVASRHVTTRQARRVLLVVTWRDVSCVLRHACCSNMADDEAVVLAYKTISCFIIIISAHKWN